LKAAKGADVVIVFGTQWTGESIDAELKLDENADALIDAVAKANKKTVVVLQTGGPVFMPWLSKVGAVVEAWYPGTKGGTAIARVLTGEVSPSGRLPVTFAASLDQLPRPKLDGDPKSDTIRTQVNYDIEGAAIGYKWFDKKGLKQLIAFGRDSVREVKKVVGPARKEALQMTGYVFAFVFVMALFMWLTDKTLEWVLYDLVLGWRR
jgi:beta-glucosidase